MTQNHGRASALLHQTAAFHLRERWTEEEVLALPLDEQDRFDRKSGKLLDDKHNFPIDMAAVLSAMANSGGGHIILGQEDDGTFSPVRETFKGREKTKDWLEKTLPWLVAYPLESFRVHSVEPAKEGSQIPAGTAVFVIDVPDSRLAPHQAAHPKDGQRYYFRSGGNSIAAPHHYLEALRNRISGAVLIPTFHHFDVQHVQDARKDSGWTYSVLLRFAFTVRNESRIVSRENSVVIVPPETAQDRFDDPGQSIYVSRDHEAALFTTILPTRSAMKAAYLQVMFDDEPLGFQIKQALFSDPVLVYAISESHVGEPVPLFLTDEQRNRLEARIEQELKSHRNRIR